MNEEVEPDTPVYLENMDDGWTMFHATEGYDSFGDDIETTLEDALEKGGEACPACFPELADDDLCVESDGEHIVMKRRTGGSDGD